ncbi:STAS domain-containing protein [Actinoplanes couchii]|uniref:STAS domain-containing protein n=1 Tax=Actinoplanes couchii TaxID=403638 RepID=UPI001942041D|nr:STAS domain-containing protein [Actinoplanes couchii]MDR6324518.1 anti-anti-sigma factor [Actinoplanes couchii]
MTVLPAVSVVIVPPSACPHTVCLALAGDLIYETGNDVFDQVQRVMLQHEHLRVLQIDCRQLKLIDSTGLSVFLQIHNWADDSGIDFYLHNPGPVLERILKVTGTYEHLTAPQQATSSTGLPQRDSGA